MKLTVYLREYGKPVDLTGYAVKYEAAGQSSNFVRVDAKVIDATKGIFEYIFSKEAVSTSSLWLAYFAFEKGEERFTTQDLKIVLGSDVKEGSIQIENYIAEFDKLKKQIDALQVAVDKADVVKRSGGTMVGNLTMDTIVGDRAIVWKGGTTDIGLVSGNSINFRLRDWTNSKDVFTYDGKTFNVPTDTNLLKTADIYTKWSQPNGNTLLVSSTNLDDLTMAGFYSGNSMVGSPIGSGTIYIDVWSHSPSYTRQEVRSATDHAGVVYERKRVSGTWGAWVNVNGNNKDTDWTNLTLINGVTNQSGKTSQIKRKGDTVCLKMNVIGVKNNHIIATLPANFRPVGDLPFSATYVLNNLDTNTGFVTIRADGSVHCEWVAEGTNPLKYWSFTLTYII